MSPTPRLRNLATSIAVASLCCAAFSAQALGAARHKPRHGPRPITLEWVGDIALSTQRGLPPGGLRHALAPVASQLHDADLTLGNLEGTLSVGGSSKCGGIGGGNCFAFQAPPSTARSLRGLGFDLVNMANNHSFDYGASGRAQTISALNRAGVAHTGLPGEITVLRSGGRRVAFVGFAPYALDANLLDIPAAQALGEARAPQGVAGRGDHPRRCRGSRARCTLRTAASSSSARIAAIRARSRTP